MKSGIYRIRNIVNNKTYVGSSKNLRLRLSSHLSLLRRNKSHSPKLQNAFNKYGENSFVFEVVEYCDVGALRYREFFYLKEHNAVDDGYNHSYNTECAARGIKRSTEFRMKLSDRNRFQSEAQRLASSERMIEFNKTQKHVPKTIHHKLKLSLAHKGKKLSLDHIEKIRIYRTQNPIRYWKGKKRSEADRLKMSLSRIGKESVCKKPVAQIFNSKIIAIHKSATDASRQLDISRTAIKNCALGYSKSAGNFQWQYV